MHLARAQAHYLEFSFEAATAAISSWFCIDNMLLADRLKTEIMVAPEEFTVVIDELSRRAAHDHGAYEPPKLSRCATT